MATGGADATLVALPPGGTERVRVDGAAELRLRTLDGKEWRVARVQRAHPDAPPLPPLAHTAARTCLDLLRDGRSVALWGPGDSEVEGTAEFVIAHLKHAGLRPRVVGSEEELAAARADRVPRPVYCTRDPHLRPRRVPRAFQRGAFQEGAFQVSRDETFFYWLAPREHPDQLDGVARLVENEDLTLDEAFARYAIANPENVRAIHERAAGAIGLMDRFFEGLTDAELARWLWEALATDDVDVLAVYRVVLDGQPTHVFEISAVEEWRLVASGLFRRDGSERNPWYREILGHRWIDEQLERRGRLPPPRFVLVLGTSTAAEEVAHALGARGQDYGLVVRGDEAELPDELVRKFIRALPSEVPRASRVQVILDANAPTATVAGALGATLVHLDGEQPQRILERANALVYAGEHSESTRALVERAQSNGIPIFRASRRDRPGDVAARALELLDEQFQRPTRKRPPPRK